MKISKRFFNTGCGGQTSILVYEGEHKIAKNNHLLGKFLFDHRKAPRGTVGFDVGFSGNKDENHIQVTFEIDRNGILTVSVVEAGTTNMKQITITNSTGYLSKEELTRHIKEAQQMESDAKFHRILSEARSALEGLQSLK